jgi:hypothetical protein
MKEKEKSLNAIQGQDQVDWVEKPDTGNWPKG